MNVPAGPQRGADPDRLFMGRRRARAAIEAWLASDRLRPRVLWVHGPAGVGKSALLLAVRAGARSVGWRVSYLDCAATAANVEAVLQALAHDDPDRARILTSPRPIILCDHVDPAGPWNEFLQGVLLPGVTIGTKLVLASRDRSQPTWADWGTLIRELQLRPFTRPETERYLRAHGIGDAGVRAQIWHDTTGLPAAVEAAADLSGAHRRGGVR